jgi:hypothetical protein
MAAKAQWGVLMLPGFCLARLCVTRREPIVIGLFAAGWCCWLMSQNLIGNNAVFVGLWYGAVLWNALLWLILSAGVLATVEGSGHGRMECLISLPGSTPARLAKSEIHRIRRQPLRLQRVRLRSGFI